MVWYAENYNLLEPAEGKSGTFPICIPASVGSLLEIEMKRIPLTQDKFALVDNPAVFER